MTNATYMEIAGRRIFVREQGRGDPILLLHGFPQTGQCWSQVANRLAEHRRVIVPDVPGFGGSDVPAKFDAATVAKMLAKLMDRLGAPRFTVVGHDWGGAFAFRLALDHQERVSRLVIVNSPFRRINLLRAFHIPLFNLPALPELWFRAFGDATIGFILRAPTARKGSIPAERVNHYQEAYRDPERIRSALAYYRTVTRHQIAASTRALGKRRGRVGSTVPRRIEVPTLLVWGMQDPVLSGRTLEGIVADIPHATVVRLEGVGHFVPEEAPEALVSAIMAHSL